MDKFCDEGCGFFVIEIKIIGGIKMKKTGIMRGSSGGLGGKIGISLVEKG